eukprot:3141878-Prymnesium_polylepis.1
MNAQHTEKYAKERIKADGTGSEAKKFVNVAMGDASGTSLGQLPTLVSGATGLMATVVEAPMFMATAAHGLTLMPISSGSLFDGVKARLTLAAHK